LHWALEVHAWSDAAGALTSSQMPADEQMVASKAAPFARQSDVV
jgi:hypothetical protein